MSFSNVSATQRQQQEEALKKVLAIGLLGSTLLHGVALPFSLKFVKPAEFAEDAIEIVMLDEPKVEEIQPEPAIEKKVSPPPETLKPEPPPEPTPPEEQPVAATPPPIPEEQPIAATPPPIPEEQPVAPTPPPEIKEELPTETPPPTPEPSPPPKEDLNSRETPKSSTAQEPEKPSPDPLKSEPPVKTSRPKGAGSVGDITNNAGNPKSSDSPENQPPASAGSGEPSSEPLNPSSGPIQRSPAAGSPVRASRPGGGSNSGNAIGGLGNLAAGDPGGSASNSPSGASKNGDIPSSEPFGDGSGRLGGSATAGSPGPRGGGPGGGGTGGGGTGGRGTGSGGTGSGGTGSGGTGGRGPGSGSGSGQKSTNPGRGRSPSGPSGRLPDTCISCGKPEYPSAAREEGRQGEVEVVFDIDPNGKPFNIKISTPSKYNDLNKAAIKAVEKWKLTSSESGIQGEIAFITFRLDD